MNNLHILYNACKVGGLAPDLNIKIYMTQLKQKHTTQTVRTKRMHKLINAFKKITTKADRIRQEILAEIESDFIFNNLTAGTQSYSF